MTAPGRTRVSCLGLLVAMATLASAPSTTLAQGGPADINNIKPVEGTGVATAVGEWSPPNGRYTATMTTTFTPAHIQPGESFTFESSMNIVDEFLSGGTCHNTTSNSLLLERVAPNTTLFNTPPPPLPLPPSETVSGNNVTTTCAEPDLYEQTVTVPAGPTEPGCYQQGAPNYRLWFPGQSANSGTIGTLRVGNEALCGGVELRVTKPGEEDEPEERGVVTGDRIDCGSTCNATYPANASVQLTANDTPGSGFVFDHWEGDCSGTQPTCSLTMDVSKDVAAIYVPKDCYRTEAPYEAYDPDTGLSPLVHTTTVNWCVDDGVVTLTGGVNTTRDLEDGFLVTVLEEVAGFSFRSEDWAHPLVEHQPGGATVTTYPRLEECISVGTLISLIPALKAKKIGSVAWNRLPKRVRTRIVGEAIGGYLEFVLRIGLPGPVQEWIILRLAPRVFLKKVVERVVDAIFDPLCFVMGKGTVTVQLNGNGTAVSSVVSNLGFVHQNLRGYDWADAGTTTDPLFGKKKLLAAPTPKGPLTVIAEAIAPGSMVGRALKLGGGRSTAKPKLLAKGGMQVAGPGPVVLTLRPTAAGRRVLRREGSAKVKVEVELPGEPGVQTDRATLGRSEERDR